MNLPDSSKNNEIGQDLAPALIQCFGLILIGYLFGRFHILPDYARKGLGIFVQNLCFPVLLFKLVATVSFESVNWSFVASVFVSKVIIFVAVALTSLILTKPVHVGKAGLYAIATTQSNDFALGIPLFMSLYQNTHSSYTSFIYVIAPVQILILNTAGFFMIEIDKQMRDESDGRKNLFISVIIGIISNPIVAMTVIGTIWNFSFNHTIPHPIGQLVDAISSSFSATALVLLGHVMAGRIGNIKGYFALTPILLTVAKILILPMILQKIVVMFTNGLNAQETQDLSSLGFIYGSIPCAPASFVYACQYDLCMDVISSAIVFSTLASAPMMFVSAVMASMPSRGFENVILYMENTIGYLSSVSLVCCLWLLTMFLTSKRWRSENYGATACLVLAQLVTSVGGILCLHRSRASESILYTQYLMTSGGIFSTRLCTVFLAVMLFLSQWKRKHLILKATCIINTARFVASFGIAFLLAGCLLNYKTPTANASPSFPLGYAQILLTAMITILCFVMTGVSLLLHHKFRNMHHVDHSSETSTPTGETTQIINADEERRLERNYRSFESHSDEETYHSKNSNRHNLSRHNSHNKSADNKFEPNGFESDCVIRRSTDSDSPLYQNCCDVHFTHSSEQNHTEQHQYQEVNSEDNHRILLHIMLLIILSVSMLVTFFLCLWKLSLEPTDGIFIELEFLDIVLNYGQGIIYFLILGLDTTIIKPLVKLWQRIQYFRNLHLTQKNFFEKYKENTVY